MSGWGAFGQAVGSALGSIGAAAFQAHSARGLSRRQRDWQEYMASTAYQRAVTDMQEAGLNPALAYQQGGATTPSGGLSGGVPVQNPVSSALEAVRTRAEIQNLKEQNTKLQAEAALTASQIPIAAAQVDHLAASAAHARAQTFAVDYTVRKTIAETNHIGSLQEQVEASTRIIMQNENLNVQEKLLAMDLVRAQIFAARESGRYSRRLANQPVISGGVLGGLINSADALVGGVVDREDSSSPPEPSLLDRWKLRLYEKHAPDSPQLEHFDRIYPGYRSRRRK